MRRPWLVKMVGTSMTPTLQPGDRCVVVRYRLSFCVVIARPIVDLDLVVKRITTFTVGRGRGVVADLRSDNRDVVDYPDVPIDKVLGRVSFRYWPPRRVGWVR